MISRKSFESNQKVWLFDSKLKLFPGKLRSRWDGPFVVQQVFPSRAVQIMDPQDRRVLMVNGQRLKSVMTYDINPGLIEFINLVDPSYYDQQVRTYLTEDTKLSAGWEATQYFQESLSLFFSFLFFSFWCGLCFQV